MNKIKEIIKKYPKTCSVLGIVACVGACVGIGCLLPDAPTDAELSDLAESMSE